MLVLYGKGRAFDKTSLEQLDQITIRFRNLDITQPAHETTELFSFVFLILVDKLYMFDRY